MVTNLPDDVLSDEIKYLYNLRWGIETSFRDLKHTIGTTNFHSKKVEYIIQEIWARLILFNFCAIVAAHVVIVKGVTKHFYQVNFAMAIKICHHFIRLRAGEPPPDVEALIGKHTLPIRLGRTFARQHRFQPPASFLLQILLIFYLAAISISLFLADAPSVSFAMCFFPAFFFLMPLSAPCHAFSTLSRVLSLLTTCLT